jgi:hypothetical protein
LGRAELVKPALNVKILHERQFQPGEIKKAAYVLSFSVICFSRDLIFSWLCVGFLGCFLRNFAQARLLAARSLRKCGDDVQRGEIP